MRPILICLAALFASFLWVFAAQAAEPAYLKDMPSAEKVVATEKSLATEKGKDDFDTRARQAAALGHIQKVMKEMEGRREFNGQTPAEQKLMRDYGNAAFKAQTDMINSLPVSERTGANSKRAKWFALESDYEYDDGFQRRVMSTYFSEDFLKANKIAHLDSLGRAARGRSLEDHPGDETKAADAYAVAQLIEMTPPPLRWIYNKQAWLAIFAVWFGLALAREIWPLRIDPKDSGKFQIGGRHYEVIDKTGVVTSVERWTSAQVQRTTTTTTDAWGNTHTSHGFYTYYTNHQLIVINDGAVDTSMEFTNQSVPVVVGQRISAIAALRRGRKWGPYIAIHSYSERVQYYVEAFKETLRFGLWPLLPLLLFKLLLLQLHLLFLRVSGADLIVLGGVYIGYLVLREPVRWLRSSLFKAQVMPRIIAGLDAPPVRDATVRSA